MYRLHQVVKSLWYISIVTGLWLAISWLVSDVLVPKARPAQWTVRTSEYKSDNSNFPPLLWKGSVRS
jgi:hypothetical protein